ncbi:MAG: PD-(D/E)XK motif protein [Hyphomicrobium sp.]|jgi:hypothetical protein|uniref:PD-(D/E)XK motif protein n=1 Tax=Hyphomicrobium sp. TaxID=82 RepID=UPI0025C4A9C6|nr:PD-(D/E)XK motif protein [Hyphomicrobium sp.]MBX9865099.1 PD-(D/E)XK motif protein [Hyphomicrobium sp.]
MPIEDLWNALRGQGIGAQRRIDATHPIDLYADFQPPDLLGIVVFTDTQPPQAPQLRAIATEAGRRADGRWSLRLQLTEPRLLTVFAELCRDIIDFTRSGVDPRNAGGAVLARLDRWQSLLQSQRGGLGPERLRGLIGELLILEIDLIPALGKDAAVAAWTGPLGTSQDFQLPNGDRIEVKAIGRNASQVRINGLQQLDAGGDRLRLAVVRLEDTGINAQGALTAGTLVNRLRQILNDAPVALATLEQLLLFLGWDDTQDVSEVVVRLDSIDRYEVDDAFPRLVPDNVPQGVLDASYVLALPATRGSMP